jgi:ElaB/YqjD/DUF883 family membrane-anchored ribosome-binding protein
MKSPTNPSSPPSENEAGELIANISRLMAEAEEMLSDSTSQHAEEKIELMRPGFYERSRRPGRYGVAKARVIEAIRRTDATIRANPYESLLVALGVGLLAGAVCFRRRD